MLLSNGSRDRFFKNTSILHWANVLQESQKGHHALVLLVELIGAGQLTELSSLETTRHGGTNIPQNLGCILVTTQHEEADTRVVSNREFGRKDRIQCVCDSKILVSGDDIIGMYGNRCQSLQTGHIIPQQTFQTRSSCRTKNVKVGINRRELGGCTSSFTGQTKFRKTMQIVENNFHIPSIRTALQQGQIINQVGLLVVGTGNHGTIFCQQTMFSRRRVHGRSKLAKPLELVSKFMQNIKDPSRKQKEIGIFRRFQNLVKQFTVHLPSFNTITNGWTRHLMPMSVRHFTVNSQKQWVTVAFSNNGLRGWPWLVSKIFGTQLFKISLVQLALFFRQLGQGYGIIKIENKVRQCLGQGHIRILRHDAIVVIVDICFCLAQARRRLFA
mmetsp:Transcript_6953/g.9038  ORF Transcript_6953/g.9038 Transcript_6953/m.9038 type:complete len:385 (-) Transcript_6953:28-1182(-)